MSRPRNSISAAAWDRRTEERAMADFYEVVREDYERPRKPRPTGEQINNVFNGYLTGRWLGKLVRTVVKGPGR